MARVKRSVTVAKGYRSSALNNFIGKSVVYRDQLPSEVYCLMRLMASGNPRAIDWEQRSNRRILDVWCRDLVSGI